MKTYLFTKRTELLNNIVDSVDSWAFSNNANALTQAERSLMYQKKNKANYLLSVLQKRYIAFLNENKDNSKPNWGKSFNWGNLTPEDVTGGGKYSLD